MQKINIVTKKTLEPQKLWWFFWANAKNKQIIQKLKLLGRQSNGERGFSTRRRCGVLDASKDTGTYHRHKSGSTLETSGFNGCEILWRSGEENTKGQFLHLLAFQAPKFQDASDIFGFDLHFEIFVLFTPQPAFVDVLNWVFELSVAELFLLFHATFLFRCENNGQKTTVHGNPD